MGSHLPPQVSTDWDELARLDTRAPVFNYREWFMLAAQEHLLRRWYVLTIRRHDRPIALLPLRKRTPWSWEVLSWFGQDDAQILVDPCAEEAAWQGVAHWLRHYPGAGYLTLGACGDSARIEAFARACRDEGMLPQRHDRVPPTVVCSLPESWEALLASLGARTRKEIRQVERNLQQDFPDFTVEFPRNPAVCRQAVEDLARLYRVRWGNRHGGCVFDAPPNIAYYQQALAWAMRGGYATAGVTRVHGQVLAVQTLFHIPGQSIVYAQMFGRDTEMLPKRYSAGMAIHCHLMRWAMAHGITAVSLGPGALPYKLVFNGTIHPRWIVGAARTPRDAVMLPRLDRLEHMAHRAPVHAANYLRDLLKSPGVPQHGLGGD